MATNPIIKQCPNCRNADQMAVYSYDSGNKYVECDRCWYRGPSATSVRWAIKFHNEKVKDMPSLSRDAEVVLYCLFMFGGPTKVMFKRAHIIHPRTRAGMDELAAAGLVDVMPESEVGKDGAGWQGNANTRAAWKACKKPTDAESFPITTE